MSGRSYEYRGRRFHLLATAQGYVEEGLASWYGRRFHHRKTASGERFNMYAFTAAHKTLPLRTKVKVTNLVNHRWVIVRINDRGPFGKGQIIDLSFAAAKKLGMVKAGRVRVRVEALPVGSRLGPGQAGKQKPPPDVVLTWK
ncbi:MAG: septal ring lytic transglycosylase RlpA family protein [Thermodesulfobacteriota bacterium]